MCLTSFKDLATPYPGYHRLTILLSFFFNPGAKGAKARSLSELKKSFLLC